MSISHHNRTLREASGTDPLSPVGPTALAWPEKKKNKIHYKVHVIVSSRIKPMFFWH